VTCSFKLRLLFFSITYGLWHAALSWDWYWKRKFNSFIDAREVSPREILLFYCSNFYALLKRHPLLPLDGFSQEIERCGHFYLYLSAVAFKWVCSRTIVCVLENFYTYLRDASAMPKQPWTQSTMMAFDALYCPYHDGETCAGKNQWLSSSNAFFSLSFSSLS
jgi:hypothetical protein